MRENIQCVGSGNNCWYTLLLLEFRINRCRITFDFVDDMHLAS